MDARILVVDDFKTMIKIIESLLTQLGFSEVDEAEDGNRAMEKLRARRYDAILCDWNIRPEGAVGLLRAVRANDGLQHIPLIFILPDSKPETLAAAKDAGAEGYMVKPFNAATLKEKLAAVLETA